MPENRAGTEDRRENHNQKTNNGFLVDHLDMDSLKCWVNRMGNGISSKPKQVTIPFDPS